MQKRKSFLINTKYSIISHYLYYTQKKKIFCQHKILNNISLLISYPEKKIYSYKRLNNILLLDMQKAKILFYQQEILNNIPLFILYLGKKTFFH